MYWMVLYMRLFLMRRNENDVQHSGICMHQVPPSDENTAFSIFSNQGLYQPLSHKRASSNGGANTKNRLISGLHSNRETYIAISHFNQCFIYYEFRWFAPGLEHLLWLVALSPIPNGNVVSLDKLRQPL